MAKDAVQAATIAVIGDVHLFWDDADVAFFNGGGYDLLLFVGDLSGYTQVRGRRVARSLRKLRVPAMCIPGNHDGLHAFQLGAEIAPRAHRLRNAFCQGQAGRCAKPGACTRRGRAPRIQPAPRCPRRCSIEHRGGSTAFDRRKASRLPSLSRRSATASTRWTHRSTRLKRLVDSCDDAPILFLAHNGPSGLGDRADSIWGCDFRKKEEDWGDRDLEEAVQYAKSSGRNRARDGRRPHAPQNQVGKATPRAESTRRRPLRQRGRGPAAPQGKRPEEAAPREADPRPRFRNGRRSLGLGGRIRTRTGLHSGSESPSLGPTAPSFSTRPFSAHA